MLNIISTGTRTYSRDGTAIEGNVPALFLPNANILVVSVGASPEECEAIARTIEAQNKAKAWSVHIRDRYGSGTELFATEEQADAAVWSYMRERWNEDEPLPDDMGEALGLFYEEFPDTDIESECLDIKQPEATK